MWRTTRGERTLAGAEATLVRKSLAAMYYALEKRCIPRGEAFESGVGLFDRLSAEQQLAMLAIVGEALLQEDVESPPLSALSQATAAAIFGALQAMVEAELDADETSPVEVLDPSTTWRSLVRNAVEAANADNEPLPPTQSIDWERWNMLVAVVSRRVLGNDDWNLEDLVVDSDPEQGAAMKGELQIKLDYFDSIAPDPTGIELDAVRERLDALTGLGHADGGAQGRA
jgi:hypothetical protein